MPLFITQGRFTQDAFKGMLTRPQDRAAAIGQLFAQAGGRLVAYYMTFGEYDFLVISEGPLEGVATTTIVAAAAGGVTDLRTTLALSSTDMRDAFARAASITQHQGPAGIPAA